MGALIWILLSFSSLSFPKATQAQFPLSICKEFSLTGGSLPSQPGLEGTRQGGTGTKNPCCRCSRDSQPIPQLPPKLGFQVLCSPFPFSPFRVRCSMSSLGLLHPTQLIPRYQPDDRTISAKVRVELGLAFKAILC